MVVASWSTVHIVSLGQKTKLAIVVMIKLLYTAIGGGRKVAVIRDPR